jgi:hypothetical protein
LQRREDDLSVPSRVIKEFGISRRAWYAGLESLVEENLISLVRRPGAKTRITLLRTQVLKGDRGCFPKRPEVQKQPQFSRASARFQRRAPSALEAPSTLRDALGGVDDVLGSCDRMPLTDRTGQKSAAPLDRPLKHDGSSPPG